MPARRPYADLVRGPWIASGIRDYDAARLVRAVYRQRVVLALDHARVPTQEQPLRPGGPYSATVGFPVGALLHLWATWPAFRGRCPGCGGRAQALAVGGMLDAYVMGVCCRCSLCVHRRVAGFGPLLRALDARLAGTPFGRTSAWRTNWSNGLPHTSLVGVLRALGETDLPDPHAYGFLGGHPPARGVVPDETEAQSRERGRIARAKSWAYRASVVHGPTGAYVEPHGRVRERVERYADDYLRARGRLPELEHDGGHSLVFRFPLVLPGTPEAARAADAAGAGTPAPEPATDWDPDAPRFAVREFETNAIFREVAWEEKCWDLDGAHAAYDARVSDNRQTRGFPGRVLLFDLAARQLLRFSLPDFDAAALVAEWIDCGLGEGTGG